MIYDYDKIYNELEKFFTDNFAMNKDELNVNVHGLMKTDIIDRESEYEVNIELPDVNKEDISLTFDNGYLKVTVNKRKLEEDNAKFTLKERYYGKISRTYYFGEEFLRADVETSAKFENGLLKIVIKKPVKLNQEPKQIKID